MDQDHETLSFDYTFRFPDGKTIHFPLRLDARTLQYRAPVPASESEWARLENQQCSNCPLNSEEHPWCPVARNLIYILSEFTDVYSFDEVEVTVKNEERTYLSNTSVQQGLSSMLGIIMVSSGCPIMARLKPMVRFHLPFASVEETLFRSVSTYLLGQYFKYKNDQPGDWDLKGLMEIYKEVQRVNMGMAHRFRTIEAKDANINALVVLDVFAKETPYNIQSRLQALEYLFNEDITEI